MRDELAQYVEQVFRLALRLANDRHMAEELTQDTMLRAVKHIDQLRDSDRLLVWLLHITTNLWRDELRRSKRQPEEIRHQDFKASDPSPMESAERGEQKQRALRALSTLPERQRAVLHLFSVEQLSIQEISEVLGINPNAVKGNLFHARAAMRKKLPDLAPSWK